MSQATTSKENVKLAPLLRMPPEICFNIVEKLEDSKDLSALSELDQNISAQARYVVLRRELAKELAQSVEAEDIQGIQKALDSGANINGFHKHQDEKDPREYTYTPLQLAAHCGRVGAAKYLLDRGAQVDITNSDDDTAFHVAVDVIDLEAARLLYKHGADVNRKNKNGYTPLHFAVLGDDAKILCFLLRDCNVDMNVESKLGETPFILAIRKKRSWLYILARHKGNEINKADRDGRTALYYAVDNGDRNLVKRLLKLGAKVDQNPHVMETSPLALALESGRDNLEILSLLHEGGGDINKVYLDTGRTILHLAVDEGRLSIVQFLIQKGVDLHQLDSCGNSALIIAVLSDRRRIVELLCRNGGNVHHKNNFCLSALDYAWRREYHDIITILSEHAKA